MKQHAALVATRSVCKDHRPYPFAYWTFHAEDRKLTESIQAVARLTERHITQVDFEARFNHGWKN